LFNPELVEQDLRKGGQAVCCARGVGDHVMLQGIVAFFIDTQSKCSVYILAGSRNNYFLGARLNVFSGFFAIPEEAGALQYHVYLQISPRQIEKVISDPQSMNLFAINC